jgi:hypothetical protein
MRPYLVVLAAALVLPLTACHRRPATSTNHHETRSFAAAPGKLVRLDVRSIDVAVEVVKGEAIDFEVTLAAHASSRAAASRWIERNTPVIDDSPSRLEISVPKRSGVSVIGFLATDGRIRIKLPPQCTLEVHTASGDVTLAGEDPLAAPVRIETASGDVTVRGGARELLLDTASGDIRVAGAALAVLEVNTASGDVRLDAGADRAVIDTASGSVTLRDLGGDLSANTSSGDLEARWARLPAGTRIRVETSSGDVRLRLPAAGALSGEMRTSSGSIESDYPGTEERRGHRFTLSGAAGTAESPSGAAGGASVTIKTNSGDVTLRKEKLEI